MISAPSGAAYFRAIIFRCRSYGALFLTTTILQICRAYGADSARQENFEGAEFCLAKVMTNLQLILLMVAHVVLYTTILFTMLYSMADRLDTEHPFAIQGNGQRNIFFGLPAIGFAALMCNGETIAHIVGEKAYPYVFFGAMGALIVIGIFSYNFVPRRWALPLGIAGWITTFSWTFWHFWFGAGANPPPL
jgi:hypothetical protein